MLVNGLKQRSSALFQLVEKSILKCQTALFVLFNFHKTIMITYFSQIKTLLTAWYGLGVILKLHFEIRGANRH